jgi:hypothetical protein
MRRLHGEFRLPESRVRRDQLWGAVLLAGGAALIWLFFRRLDASSLTVRMIAPGAYGVGDEASYRHLSVVWEALKALEPPVAPAECPLILNAAVEAAGDGRVGRVWRCSAAERRIRAILSNVGSARRRGVSEAGFRYPLLFSN